MMITFKFLNHLQIILFLLVKFKLEFTTELEIIKILYIKFIFSLQILKIFNQDKPIIFLAF